VLLRPDSLGAHDLLTDAVMVLLGESGASGLSLRKLAEVEGLRQALVAPTPLSIDRACAALRTVEERFGISPAELDLTGPPAWLYPTG
jgi:hypothetical protein